MKQMTMTLKLITNEPVHNDISLALRSLYDSMCFDFTGRLKTNSKGFEYRYGRKTKPKDWKIKRKKL